MFRYSIVFVGILAACSSDGDLADPIPFEGSAAITVTTTGDQPDPDGYSIRIGPSASIAVGVNQKVVIDRSQGEHSLEVNDVAENCRVDGGRTRTFTITTGDTTNVAINVDCPTPAPILTMLLAPATSSAPNEIVTYWVNVASGVPDLTPTGQVTISVTGGDETCTETLTSTELDSLARATCSMTFINLGNDRLVTVTYSGDPYLTAATLTFLHDVSTTNRPPQTPLLPDPVHVVLGQTATFQLPATDPDGDPLTFTVVRAPLFGTFDLHPDGSLMYTPNVDMQYDMLEFRASDGKSLSDVTILKFDSGFIWDYSVGRP